MNQTTYECVFNFQDATCRVESWPSCGIGMFRDGFWINADYEFTTGIDSKYWIPPHAIKFIEKRVREVL